jgi:hypothetical protein
MLFQSPRPDQINVSDAVHERIVAALAGLEVEGWRYQGYRRATKDREPWIVLRFEKGIVDKLAAADVRVKLQAFQEPFFPVHEFLSTRLRAVEGGLADRRRAELALN